MGGPNGQPRGEALSGRAERSGHGSGLRVDCCGDCREGERGVESEGRRERGRGEKGMVGSVKEKTKQTRSCSKKGIPIFYFFF